MVAVLMVLHEPRANADPTVVSIDPDNVFYINGRPMFPIGFSTAPPPEGVTPRGEDAYLALKQNGAVFHRCGGGTWGPAAEAELDHLLDRSAEAGLLCAITIPDLSAPGASEIANQIELRRVVAKYKDHPGLGFWKGKDEPEWGRTPVENCQRFYDIVHQIDDNHPVWITQAPRGSIESLTPYDPTYDVGAIDIYPIGYPPGTHGNLPNRNISVVGDYANWMQQITQNRKPFWMVLQIAWSGVIPPAHTLRMPTFFEERYMTYQAIINGARGVLYFGGNIGATQNDRDRQLGWNWTFFRRVLKPLLRELDPQSPLYSALIAPVSTLPVQASGADDVEFTVRESNDQIFILAAKREGPTAQVRFRGLPLNDSTVGDVLFEEPRRVTVSNQSFSDWFGPNEVHLYRFSRQ
jgi:hypothetical protein